MQHKKLAGRSFFSKLGLAGSGARKPMREFKGSTLKPFLNVVSLKMSHFSVYHCVSFPAVV